jgi:Glycosyltransferase family 87
VRIRAAAGAVLALALVLASAPVDWPLDDFHEYWTAGRLNAAGDNPYDAGAMLREQRRIGWQESQPVMMYNPPWTLALAMPAGALSFPVARSLWLPIQILIVVWCASQLWRLYGGSPRDALRAIALTLVWMPVMIALRMGQVSPLVLLGLVGFLVAVSEGRDIAAGAFFALTAVKPQLVALVWIALALWIVSERRWRIGAGTATMIGAASLVALTTNARVFTEYQQLMASAPPTQIFESPNLATVLRVAIGTDASWPQYIPTLLGAVIVAAMWYRRKKQWSWEQELPTLTTASCLVTSYGGWTFDLVVLLLPILVAGARLTQTRPAALRRGLAIFLAISATAFTMHAAHAPQAAFIWMTPAVAIASYLLLTDSSVATGCPVAQSAKTPQRSTARMADSRIR